MANNAVRWSKIRRLNLMTQQFIALDGVGQWRTLFSLHKTCYYHLNYFLRFTCIRRMRKGCFYAVALLNWEIIRWCPARIIPLFFTPKFWRPRSSRPSCFATKWPCPSSLYCLLVWLPSSSNSMVSSEGCSFPKNSGDVWIKTGWELM